MTRRHSRGSSLLEVLVSLVVVSIGSLSMASLQLLSKKNIVDADQRLQAAELANGLLERLRANNSRDALRAYAESFTNDVGSGRFARRLGLASRTAPSPDCSASSTCTPAQLARFDAWLWEQLIDGVREQYTLGGVTLNAGGLAFPTVCLLVPATGAGDTGAYTLTIAFRGGTALANTVNAADPTDACGRGATVNDVLLYGDGDQYRRLVSVQAYIVPAVPK